jgi:glycosyltransferase involved in cell wall biosynthesis
MASNAVKIVAVVPAFRCADTIVDTVRGLRDIELVDEVVVVDDASGDETAVRAEGSEARVIVNGRNLGKGGSLNRVLPCLDFDILLLVDGDLGACSCQARCLLGPVVSGEADLAVAEFPTPLRKGGFGLAQGMGRAGIMNLAGRTMRSPLSGQRAMTRRAFERLEPFDGGFGMEVGMTIDALRAGLRIVEVETTMSHSETGRDLAGFAHRGRQFAHIARALAGRAVGRVPRAGEAGD